MKQQGSLAVFLFTTAVFLACGRLSQSQTVSIATNDVDIAATIKDATRITMARQSIGMCLVNALRDSATPSDVRLSCVSVLVDLNYTESIPTIISLIDLRDVKGESSEAVTTNLYPCIRALTTFGVSAIPSLVDAWLKEDDQRRRVLLMHTMRIGKDKQITKKFVRGLVDGSATKEFQSKVSDLLGALEKE